jgi:flavin-binding protein dodecin
MAKSSSVARVTEVIASSSKSFDDAIKAGIERATQTLKNVKGAWVKDMSMKVNGSKVSEYRVNLQITFVLTD